MLGRLVCMIGLWLLAFSAFAQTSVNVALQANGGVASASSTNGSYLSSYANNGDRKGAQAAGVELAGWIDSTFNSYPDWLQINFSGMKSIGEIDVFTVQNNYTAPVDPTPSMTFTLYGITAFQVQYWNGGAWVDVPGGVVTGNSLVWRQFTFAPISTDRIRVLVNASLATLSRITEVEAWSAAGPIGYQVSGTVTVSGSPLAGVAFATTNGGTCTSSNASGQYSCTVPQGWSGSVTPSLAGYTFTSASRNYSNVTANQTAQDYAAASAVTIQVSGTVTVSGSPFAGVAFTATNGVSCISSNASGQYSCTVPQGWSGSVTPSLSGYSFTPPSRSYSNVVANQPAQDFAAQVIPTSAPIFYIHPDHLNTPRVITNQAQQVVWRWDQGEPFANNLPNENPSGLGNFTCNLRLPGQYFDKETNLHYNYFRDCYDPAIGRYCQSDPIGLEGGINTYAYAENNPLSYTDPEGLQGARPGGGPRIRPGSILEQYYVPLREPPPRTANYPSGSSRLQISMPRSPQQPAGEVCGQNFSGHAFDQMQGRGIPPSVVIDAIATGQQYPGSTPVAVQYYSPANNITVVVNPVTSNVITVRQGPPSGGVR